MHTPRSFLFYTRLKDKVCPFFGTFRDHEWRYPSSISRIPPRKHKKNKVNKWRMWTTPHGLDKDPFVFAPKWILEMKMLLSMHLKTTSLFDFTIMAVSFQQVLQLPIMLSLFIGISLAVLVLTWLSTSTRRKGEIPGKLGIPFLGQTLAFLAATNSTKGCYDFVRLRRSR